MNMFRGGLINIITPGTGGGGGAGVTSLEGLSGVIDLDSPDESVNIQTAGQVIQLTTPNSGFAPSGASILLREYDDNNEITKARILSATSGIILDDRGTRSTSGLVVKLDFDNEPTVGQSLTWNGTKLLWATITGGGDPDTQTSINGLSGVVSLTSANSGALNIIQDGQTLILSGLFTPESGSIVDQKCADILILSGIINGLPTSQTSIEGLSGVVDLDSPDESINIQTAGQTIQITTPNSGFAPSGASFILRAYDDNNHLPKARILNATSGVRLDDQGARSTSGLVVTLDFDDEPATGQILSWAGTKLGWISPIDTQMTLNGLSGAVLLDSPTQALQILASGQTILVSGIFTPASGAVLQQKCDDILTLSGLIGGVVPDAGQTSINGISGVTFISGINNEVTVSGQTILVSGHMNAASGAVLAQKCDDILTLSGLIGSIVSDAGQTSIEGLSGVIDLGSPNDSIAITTAVQTINLEAIFTWASGQLLESLVIGSGVRSINDISGIVDLVSENNGLTVTNDGQVIRLTSLFTGLSGTIVDQKCADILILSGLVGGIISDAGQTSINGLSGTLGLISPDLSINIANSGTTGIEITVPGSGAPSGASYLLREYDDNNHLTKARVLSATSGIRLLDRGTRSLSGLVATLDFDDEPQGVEEQELTWNGTKLQWGHRVRTVRRTFTATSGIQFVLQHGLNTEDWTWSMWGTETIPPIITLPDNIYPSGVNHAVLEFIPVDETIPPLGIDGYVIFVG